MTKPAIKTYQPPSKPGSMSNRSVPVKRIFWHCTADPEGSGKGPDDVWNVHVNINGWSHIGYHYVITEDGTIWSCRPEDKVGAGVSGQNSDSVHISYVGGMDKPYVSALDTRTKKQKQAMYDLTDWLLEKHGLVDDDIYGHNEYSSKACPSFNVNQDIDKWRGGEHGDPEPGDPDMGAIGLFLKELQERISRLENHNSEWDQ